MLVIPSVERTATATRTGQLVAIASCRKMRSIRTKKIEPPAVSFVEPPRRHDFKRIYITAESAEIAEKDKNLFN